MIKPLVAYLDLPFSAINSLILLNDMRFKKNHGEGYTFFGVDLGGVYFSGVANANSATPGARIRASWSELNGCFLWTIHYLNEAVLHFQINNEQTISIFPSDLRIAIRPKNSLFTKCVCVRNYFWPK